MGAEIGDLHERSRSLRFAAMILTCPECATRYFIDGGAIGFSGRTVRCSSCNAAWHVYPPDDEEPLELSSQPEADDGDGETNADEPPAEEPSLADLPAAELPGAFRAKAEEKRRVRQAAAHGAVWAGVAAGLALTLGLLAVFRADVVKAWPKSASAYAAVGLPVNTVGLTIEGVEAQPGLEDGRAAVVVTGALRNIQDHPVTAPALRINLLNKTGRTVQGKIAAPADPTIPPGETRHFTIALLDPPSSATDVEVVFDMARRQAVNPTARAKAPTAAQLRAAPPPPRPEPVEAKPIEEGPLALPDDSEPHG